MSQVLFGDRYGNAAVLRSIPEDQYDSFKEIATTMRVKHADLLQECYEYDTNAVPPCYALKVSHRPTGMS